jgi:hypothetical protein
MGAFEELRAYFSRTPEVCAVYVYGRYPAGGTYPDTDIELGLAFPPETSEDEVSAFLERLGEENPLGPAQGVLMPSVLNQHAVPVVYEMLGWGTLLVENDRDAHGRFLRTCHAKIEAARDRLLEEAREVLQQARRLGEGVPDFRPRAGQPLRMLDPLRVGWRLGRLLASVAVVEVGTRDVEEAAKDPERVNQVVSWFSNGAGAATGIAKAMLSTYEVERPMRRWQVFLPLADLGLLTTEHALWMAALVETRWNLLTAESVASPERALVLLRTYLHPLLQFARVASWATEMPAVGEAARLH